MQSNKLFPRLFTLLKNVLPKSRRVNHDDVTFDCSGKIIYKPDKTIIEKFDLSCNMKPSVIKFYT